jgi:hypothetical protein
MNTVVYQWLREEGTPYYIGIGNPRRPYKGRRSCGRPPSRDRIVILHENLEWEEACRIEKELIAFHGRVDLGTGILRNMTDGGDGVVNPSKEIREKISKSLFGENNPMFGKFGENHPMFGKSPSKETRGKISKSLSGENNPNFGKSLSKETREKISKGLQGKKHSEETKRKISEMNSGKNHPRYTPINWYHPDYGEVLQKSTSEMVKLFPDQKLDSSCLSKVARGEQSYHKGWITLKARYKGFTNT